MSETDSIDNRHEQVRVLHLEDSAHDGELVSEFLRADGLDCDILRVWTGDDFTKALKKGGVDLILADHQLPAFDGAKALEIARTIAADVPFIFVSGTLGEDVAVEALRNGATDYVVKQRLDRLAAVAERAIAENNERKQRKRAQDALSESEREFRFAMTAGRFGVWSVDFAGGEMKTSEIFRSSFGRNPTQAFTYDELRRALHPDDLQRMEDAVAHSLATGEDYDVEYRIITPDGKILWIAIRGQPVFSAGGAVHHMSGVSIDITEKRQEDDRRSALIELSDVFRRLDDPAEIAYSAAEILGRTLNVSRAGYGTIDLADESITIDCDWNAPGIKSLAGVLKFRDFGTYLDDLKRGEIVLFADAMLDPRTVATADALINVSARAIINMPVVEQRGLVALLYLNHADVRPWTDDDIAFVREVAERTRIAVERRRVENELRELANSLEHQVAERTAERDRIWKNSRDLLTVIDAKGVFLAVNPAWSTVLGHEHAALVGRYLFDYIWPEDLNATQNALVTASGVSDLTSFVNRYRHADGSPRWISWHTFREGELVYCYGRDVTAEKQQSDALLIAQDSLRQSQKLEAMGQLTGGVAHDFNNLLTPILGSLDLLRRRNVGTEREQRLIEGALQSAERAKTLIQRLLAFARRQPLQPSAVDVGGLVSGMADLIASTSGPQIRVAVHVADELPAAKGDPNQLEMAILNLSVNARDAMPEGGTLTVAAASETIGNAHRSQLKPGPYVRLSVADTGTGMDDATRARAIEPFFSTKGIGKGTGLGLSMVHGLVAQLGGALAISSKPGLGTSVDLWLPATDTEAASGGREDEAALQRPSLGRVLLVDDEDVVRMTTADMLTDIGYDVVEANSAETALRQLDAGMAVDLLITDHLMPGMTGADLARSFKSRRPGKPVLIVSGYADTEAIAPDLPRLAKPFRQAELVNMLSSMMSRNA